MLHAFLLDNRAFTTIDAPGAAGTQGEGINDRGQIVGTYADAGGMVGGFLLDNGTFTTINFPGATDSRADAINDRGQIAGGYTDAAGFHGYRLTNGAFIT